MKYCVHMSAPSDDERIISLGVRVSILIEADDGQHEKSEYRNPKTHSRYFRAKSGETEAVTIYLRKNYESRSRERAAPDRNASSWWRFALINLAPGKRAGPIGSGGMALAFPP